MLSYWESLFAHRHWVTIRFFGKEMHLCARCSGTVTGFFTLKIFFTALVFEIPYSIPFYSGLSLSILLSLPSILDWSSHNLGFRQSNNKLRLFMGFLVGVGIGLLSVSEGSLFVKATILIIISAFILIVAFIAQRIIR